MNHAKGWFVVRDESFENDIKSFNCICYAVETLFFVIVWCRKEEMLKGQF